MEACVGGSLVVIKPIKDDYEIHIVIHIFFKTPLAVLMMYYTFCIFVLGS